MVTLSAYREKRYEWSFEIAGPYAMFTRPDTGAAPVSYPAPTRSALIGMANCLAFSRDAYFWPERVELCAPVIYHKYVQNYRGPLRKPGTQGFQIMITVLEDVDYKVYGVIKGYQQPEGTRNPMHEFQEVLNRRLSKGLLYRTPSLGLKEFTASYFGPIRPESRVEQSINISIPAMLDTMYDRPTQGGLSPQFARDVAIERGVLRYAERTF